MLTSFYRYNVASNFLFIEIGKATGITGGKWLVYGSRDTIDEKWAKITKATVDGKLGTASKVCM